MNGLCIANKELERMWKKKTCSTLTFTGVVRDNHDICHINILPQSKFEPWGLMNMK